MATGYFSVSLQYVVVWLVGGLPVTSTHCNLALKGMSRQSTSRLDSPPSLAVDGNTHGNWYHGSCAHTQDFTTTPWFWVDLGESVTIRLIHLYNRADCCSERLRDVHVGVTSDDPGSPILGTYPLCGTHPGIVGSVAHITCPQGVTGRYVIVQLPGFAQLTLCEVEVFRGVTVHTGNSVYSDWVLGHRLVGQNMMMRYVRAGLECVTVCRQQEGCMSVNFAADCETGTGCCELNVGDCSQQQQEIQAPGWMWMEV